MNNRVDLHFWEASSKRCLFFLSQQQDGSFDALRVAGLRHGGVGDEVDVGSLRAGSAFVGAVPAVGKAVEGADHVVNCVGILFESGRNTFDAVQEFGARAVAEAAGNAR